MAAGYFLAAVSVHKLSMLSVCVFVIEIDLSPKKKKGAKKKGAGRDDQNRSSLIGCVCCAFCLVLVLISRASLFSFVWGGGLCVRACLTSSFASGDISRRFTKRPLPSFVPKTLFRTGV